MGLPEENLALLLLYSLTVGAFLGVLWDFFRIIRIAVYGKRRGGLPSPIRLPAEEKAVTRALSFKHAQKVLSFSGISIFLSDLFFCLAAAVSVILLLFHLNGGEIRGFALFGAGVGFAIYYFTVGKITVIFSDLIIRGIKKLIHLILSVTFIPIFKLLRRLTGLISGKILARLRKNKTKAYIKRRIKEAETGFRLLSK